MNTLNGMNTSYNAVKTAFGFKAYGPFATTMTADDNGVITYSNVTEDSVAYKKLAKRIAVLVKAQ